MSEFEKLYDRFQITAENCDNLRHLVEPALHLRRPAKRVVVETVVVENGERRIVKKEEQDAKLV
ncbi:hypothetical protein [Chitinivorax sp. B]|uniref:hypothetical protein n=1 Tax=Chitinivorax sp. B TaxID=2502235 RepID=UPI0010F4AE63|nr:hypothetical protein [Chitinivorax sp. B]